MNKQLPVITASIFFLIFTSTFFINVTDQGWETKTLNQDHGDFVAVESAGSETFLFYTKNSEGGVLMESAKTSGYLPVLKQFLTDQDWEKTWIDNETGSGSYLSAASTGEDVFLGYQVDTPGNEKVMMASSREEWNTTLVDEAANSGINVGMHTSITSYRGEPFLIYHSPRNGLITALKQDQGWDINTRKDGLGRLTSSASCGDSLKAVYVGRDTDKIRLAEYNGGWEAENLSNSARSAIALDTRNCRPYTVFLQPNSEDIVYRSPEGVTEKINSSDYTRLGINVDEETVHVSYQNYGNGLYYAEKTSEGWNRELIDSDPSAGRYNDLEVDEAGNIHLIYSDGKKVEYAVLKSGNYETKQKMYTWIRALLLTLTLAPLTFLRKEIYGLIIKYIS